MSFPTLLACVLVSAAAAATSAQTEPLRMPAFENRHCSFSEVSGIGREEGFTRRDPSDIIRVDGAYYVWYSRVDHAELPERDRPMAASGYVATIWYATSTDQGHTWTERGQALGPGPDGAFDAHAVFTPNILKAVGKYYLFYTGVRPTPGRPEGGFANNSTADRTAIGLAAADTPDGPFHRLSSSPVLSTSTPSATPGTVPSKFDSYRVDDAALLLRGGKVWLYYKGRNFDDGKQGPRFTQMGVAIADAPEGPYVKQNSGNPILDKSHEVLIWPHREGVAAYASISKTVEYAPDGLDFSTRPLAAPLEPKPIAPGAFRAGLTEPAAYGSAIRWGIAMRDPGGPCPYLVRWEWDVPAPISP